MNRSHLEIYVEILNLLSQKGPQEQTHIMQNVSLNFKVLKENLGFLVKQAMVEKRAIGKARPVFTITQRGINVTSYFSELNQTLLTSERA